jgi:rhomboid family GlyGly-CTERM serine protease
MKTPVLTLLLCGIATVVYFVPVLGGAAIYDRDLIQAGEWWRLITGNLVHFSVMHFTYDVVALSVIGTAIELRGDRYLWLLYCFAGTAIGIAVYIASPELRFYGGLSGIVSAAVVYLCLDGLHEPGIWRGLCGFALAFVAIKIGIELALGLTFLSIAESQPFIPVPVSHLAGACSALFVFVLTRYKHGIRSVFERAAST